MNLLIKPSLPLFPTFVSWHRSTVCYQLLTCVDDMNFALYYSEMFFFFSRNSKKKIFICTYMFIGLSVNRILLNKILSIFSKDILFVSTCVPPS